LLHQHQRPRRTATTADGRTITYIEAAPADVELANRLAHDVLGQSLDELPPQTRRLLILLDTYVTGDATSREVDRGQVRFTRRQLRELFGWGDTQLKVHLARLVDMELVWAHRGTGLTLVYELAWSGEGQDGSRFVCGLTPPTATAMTADRSGPDGNRSGAGRPPVGPRSGAGRDGAEGPQPAPAQDNTAPEASDRPASTEPGPETNGVVVVSGVG